MSSVSSKGADQAVESRKREPEPLLPCVAKGQHGAVERVLDRYGPLVLSIARRAFRTGVEAEDAVQDVFVDLWKSAGRFDPSVSSEKTFVAMIARRRVTDRLRKQYRDRLRPSEEFEAVASSGGPTTDVNRLVISAFEELREEQKQVLRLTIQSGMTHEEIARALSMPLGTVKTHARRGLQKIRSLLGTGSGTEVAR